MTTLRHVFIMDPIAGIRIDKDSTFALMYQAQDRGHQVLYAEPSDLYVDRGQVKIVARTAALQRVQGAHASLGPPKDLCLADVDVVWMRKDPPFDIAYVFAAQLLDLVAKKTLVVNHPKGLLTMGEKVWAMNHPQLVPETLVTQDMARVRAMAEELGRIVVKPLDGNGGEGVFVLGKDDPNIGVILEMSTRHGSRQVMAQRYLPDAKRGDKRIILIEGQPVGAILRVPQGVDHRGNMHAGATVEKTGLTARDKEICDAIGPELYEMGQIFVGIDVIGEHLTEVNVTSPTGIHEINAFDDVCLEAQVLDAVQARLS